jgi:hypothetical protein
LIFAQVERRDKTPASHEVVDLKLESEILANFDDCEMIVFLFDGSAVGAVYRRMLRP